jgi:hypothetical protein
MLFHVSRNEAKRGTTDLELVQAAERAIRSALPDAWSVTSDLPPALAGSRHVYRPDARLTIAAPDGTSAVVLIECKGGSCRETSLPWQIN